MISNNKTLYNFNNGTPIWFMRQAGRYMKEYIEIKKKFNSFFDMCRNVSAVTEITMLPVNKFGFDAGIIFSDILIILECLNVKVEFVPNKGPVVHNKNLTEIFNKKEVDLQKLNPVYESIKKVKKNLSNLNKPLIGFAGAPWTVAAYLIEGNLSKDLSKAKLLAYKDPVLMEKIINALSELVTEHLKLQIKSGADIIQIFDTHSNVLDYVSNKKYSLIPIKKICSKVRETYPNVPIAYFSKNTNFDDKDLLDLIDIISFSSTIRMKDYIKKMPDKLIFQGNLDPVKLLAGGKEMEKAIFKIMQDMENKDFIFNLGHGILPSTPTENVVSCINLVKTFKN